LDDSGHGDGNRRAPDQWHLCQGLIAAPLFAEGTIASSLPHGREARSFTVRFNEKMLRTLSAGMIISVLLSGPLFAQTVSSPGKSSGEIAAASRLLAEKGESCRVEAKQQHLHLLKRRSFIRACMKK
jgi:hypothetical protein